MPDRLADYALEHPIVPLGAAAVLLVAAGALAFAGPGDLTTADVLPATRSGFLDDLTRLGVIICPILFLGLIAALGWRLALATLAIGGISLLGAATALRLAGAVDIVEPLETSLAPAAVIAPTLAIEATLVVAASYKRALSAGGVGAYGAARDAATAGGGAVLAAALAAAVMLGALAVFDIDYLSAAALAGSASALLAGLAALLILPASMFLWGWSVPGFAEAGFWQRSAALIGWKRLGAFPVVLIVVAGMLLQATPIGRTVLATFISSDPSGLVTGFTDQLPLMAAVGAGAVALILIVASRHPVLSIALAAAGLLPAATAAGLTVLVFQEGQLTELFDYAPEGVLHLGAVACGAAAVAAVAGARSGACAAALRRYPDMGVVQGLVGPANAIGTLLVAAAAFSLLGTGLLVAKEFGFLVGAGLLLDLVAVRALLVPALTRLTVAA